jgi:hypothetical protein
MVGKQGQKGRSYDLFACNILVFAWRDSEKPLELHLPTLPLSLRLG